MKFWSDIYKVEKIFHDFQKEVDNQNTCFTQNSLIYRHGLKIIKIQICSASFINAHKTYLFKNLIKL